MATALLQLASAISQKAHVCGVADMHIHLSQDITATAFHSTLAIAGDRLGPWRWQEQCKWQGRTI